MSANHKIVESTKVKDMRGLQYGRLTVIQFVRIGSDRRAIWLCQCNCGNHLEVPRNRLISKNTKSCGCIQQSDLKGHRFDKLVVVNQIRDENSIPKERFWRCRCDCGEYKDVSTANLLSGRTRSCGCLIRKAHWHGYEDLGQTYFGTIERRAKRKGLEFAISIEYLWNLYVKQDRKCALSGLPIKIVKSVGSSSASLDRIDSSGGYTVGNVQWVHKDVNRMKMDYEQAYFVKLCRAIASNSDQPIAAHAILRKSERSSIAEMAATLL